MRCDEQSEKIEHVWKLAASPQIKGDSRPPRILDEIIEMMFPLAALGRFNFDSRLLPVESIDYTKSQRSEVSESDTANRKCRPSASSDDESRNRNLVRRCSR